MLITDAAPRQERSAEVLGCDASGANARCPRSQVAPSYALLDEEVLRIASEARPAVLAIFRSGLRDMLAARAATCEVFERLRSKVPQLRFPDAHRVITWLKRTAHLVFLEYLRWNRSGGPGGGSGGAGPCGAALCLDAVDVETGNTPVNDLTYADLPLELHEEALKWSPEDALLERERLEGEAARIQEMRRALALVEEDDRRKIADWDARSPGNAPSVSRERQSVLRARNRAKHALARLGVTSARRFDEEEVERLRESRPTERRPDAPRRCDSSRTLVSDRVGAPGSPNPSALPI